MECGCQVRALTLPLETRTKATGRVSEISVKTGSDHPDAVDVG